MRRLDRPASPDASADLSLPDSELRSRRAVSGCGPCSLLCGGLAGARRPDERPTPPLPAARSRSPEGAALRVPLLWERRDFLGARGVGSTSPTGPSALLAGRTRGGGSCSSGGTSPTAASSWRFRATASIRPLLISSNSSSFRAMASSVSRPLLTMARSTATVTRSSAFLALVRCRLVSSAQPDLSVRPTPYFVST